MRRGIFVGAGEILGVYKTLFENDARYFTGTVVEKSRITRIPEQVLKDRIAASAPFTSIAFATGRTSATD